MNHPCINNNTPVFKRMGIIEQWGNGLQIIADELKKYPEIDFKWSEPGIAFRVSFIKKNYKAESEKKSSIDSGEVREKFGRSSGEIREKFGRNSELVVEFMIKTPSITIPELAEKIKLSTRSIEKIISKLKENGVVRRIGSTKAGYWDVINK